MSIPLAKPDINDLDIAAVLSVLQGDEGRLALGPQLQAFEEKLAECVCRQYAVAVNSGTSALHLIIRSLGIGPKDEVITTPFSFIASTNCILMEGATPVFVDIDPRTLCIDPELVEAAITSKTKAILAVDVFAHPADWAQLERIAKKHDLLLIEDSVESLGTWVDDKPCGSFGRAASFGFYPNKQITSGEGGAVVTDDEELAELCRSMADQGRGNGGRFHHVRFGYNYRLGEMSAALGLSQLKRIEEIVVAKANVAGWYLEEMGDMSEVVLPSVADGVRISWFVFVIRLADVFTRADRDQTMEALRVRGIGCRDYFQPIHLQPFIQAKMGTRVGQFPITESISDRTIALPFFPQMTRSQVEQVVESLSQAISR